MNLTTGPMNMAVGSTYIIVPLLILPIYLVLLYIFIADAEFAKSPAYRLFINLGVFECAQLVIHASGGFLTFFPSVCDIYPICKILGATINSAWVALFPATCTIAVQRLLIVRRFASDNEFSRILKAMVIVNWLYFICFYLTLLTVASVDYSPNNFCWTYEPDQISQIVANIEYFICLPSAVITFLIYILVIYEILKLKRSMSSTFSSLKARQEQKILLQSLIIFLNLVFLLTCWHHFSLFFPESSITYFVINCYWIFYCGLNPLLYLTMNKTIQQKFISFLRCHGLTSRRESTILAVTGSGPGPRSKKSSNVSPAIS